MSARIFISYRTSDGMDKATALARELAARFGDDQVFLDKEDLRGGSSWRDEVGRVIGSKPVLLLLLTPHLFSATDHAGKPRLADPDDPVRREFGAALDAGAHIVPLCCDGVDAPPPADELPAPFDRLGDYTWRRLRAYDWKADFERIVADLQALGVPPRDGAALRGAGPAADADAATTRTPKRLALIAAALAGIALVAVLGWRGLHPDASRTEPAGTVALVPPGLPGTWIATLGADPPFALTLQQQDKNLVLTSVPVPVDNREGWTSYRAYWLSLTGTELRSVVYRGQGTVITDPGVPLAIDIAWKVFNGAGDTMIDSGNLHASAAPDGRSLEGKLWSNGDQADRPVVLRRPR